MSKPLTYWKQRCVDARQLAEMSETDEMRMAYRYAQRKVECLERKMFNRKGIV